MTPFSRIKAHLVLAESAQRNAALSDDGLRETRDRIMRLVPNLSTFFVYFLQTCEYIVTDKMDCRKCKRRKVCEQIRCLRQPYLLICFRVLMVVQQADDVEDSCKTRLVLSVVRNLLSQSSDILK